MQLRINNRRDFFAGLFFSTLGVLVGTGSLEYSLGNAMRMGPGYFPLILAASLVGIGLFVLVHSVAINHRESHQVEAFALRPITFVAAGILIFAFSVHSLGLIVATLGLVIVSGVAYEGFRWRELTLLGLSLSAFAVGVFSYGLSLPFQALPV